MTDLELMELAFRRAASRLTGNGPLQFALHIVADEILRVEMEKCQPDAIPDRQFEKS